MLSRSPQPVLTFRGMIMGKMKMAPGVLAWAAVAAARLG
jgi:hypothetical protein